MNFNQKNALYMISYQNFLGGNVYEKIWKIGSSYNVLNRLISYKTYSPFRFKVEKVFIITNNPFKEDGVNTDSVSHILDDLIQIKIDEIENEKIYRTHTYNKKNQVYNDIKILKKEDNLNIGGTEWYYTNDLKELIKKIKKILDDLETEYKEYDTIEIHEMISKYLKDGYETYKNNMMHSSDFPKKKKYSKLKNRNKYIKKIKLDIEVNKSEEYKNQNRNKIVDEENGEECKVDDNCKSKCCKNNECVDSSLCKIKNIEQKSLLEIQPYFHQYMIFTKILKQWNKTNQFLIGAMPRSGKSYIMSFLIKELFEKNILKNNNILVVTTYPTETIEGYKDAINDIIKTNNIITKGNMDTEKFMKTYKEKENNIVLLSIQSLFKDNSKNKINIKELKKIYKENIDKKLPKNIKKEELLLKCEKYIPKDKQNELTNKQEKIFNNFLKNFNVIFTDEFHYSGKTDKSVNILKKYLNFNKDNKIIHMSGTYVSIKKKYNIRNNYLLNWEYEDIRNMKEMNDENEMKLYLDDKNIDYEIYDNYKNKYNKSFNDIVEYYRTFPEPKFLFLNGVIEISKLFALDNDTGIGFKNEPSIIKIFDDLFNSRLKFIQKFSEKNNSRTLNSNLTYKKGTFNIINNSSGVNKTGVIIFLPDTSGSKVSDVSVEIKNIINQQYKNQYNVLLLNSNNKIKKELEKEYGSVKKGLEEEFKKSDKTMIIIVRGMLEAGISLKFVDIVVKLHSSTSYTKNQQQTYRASTEDAENYKKYSWIIDYNQNNTLNVAMKQLRKKGNREEKIKKIKEYNMILNPDDINLDFDEDNYYEYIDDLFDKNKLNINIKKMTINKEFLKNFSDKIKETLNIMKLKKGKKNSKKKKKKQNQNESKPNESKPNESKPKEVNDILDEEKILDLINKLIEYITFLNYFYDMNQQKLTDIVEYIKKDEKYLNLIKYFIISNYIEDKKIKFNITNIVEELMDIIKNLEIEEEDSKLDFEDLNKTLVLQKNKEYNEKINDLSTYEDKINFIHELMNPTKLSTKSRGEVFTPFSLIQEKMEMLDEYGNNALTKPNPYKKWLDPAGGIGNYPLYVYNKLMNTLKDYKDDKINLTNKEVRRKWILENMIYYSELNELNSFIYRKLIDPENKYKLNIHQGDSLNNDLEKYFGTKFDYIIGNPPFQDSSGNKSNSLWPLFVKKSLKEWLNKDGFLTFIHPSKWRNYGNKLFELIKKYNLIKLTIHSPEESKKIFNVSTRSEYYLLQKSNYNGKTTIISNNKKEVINLNEWSFLPNNNFKTIKKILAKREDEKQEIIHSESLYEIRKKWMSKTKTDEFKYPVIYQIDNNNNPVLFYSKINNAKSHSRVLSSIEHYGVKKVIFGNGSGILYDNNGEYAMSQWNMGIEINDQESANKLIKIIQSEKWKNIIIDSLQTGANKYNKHVLRLFKKDFWKILEKELKLQKSN